jgi:hypothetical protein
MLRLAIFITVLVDFSLLFVVRLLEWYYGIENGSDVSARTFQIYKNDLVPARDNYIMGALAINCFLVALLLFKYIKGKEKPRAIEVMGLTVCMVTIVVVVLLKAVVPKGYIM